jgi:hypothetical protein
LRADESETHGPRKRVERRKTADGAGRTVYVEHIKLAGGDKESLEKTPAKWPGKVNRLPGAAIRSRTWRPARPARAKTHDNPRAKGPKGKTERDGRGGEYPTPPGQKPRRPREKS